MDNDISVILLRIKDNIHTVEDGDVTQVILEKIDSDFHQLMELIKLFLISERDSYYGFILMNLSFRTAFFSESIAGIMLNEFPPVFKSNPLLLCKFSLKEIIYFVCHEIDHILLNHPAEMVRLGQYNPDLMVKFNLAADAAVNDRINDEIKKRNYKFIRQPEGIITSDVLAKMFELKTIARAESYRYYFDLIKDRVNPDAETQNQSQNMSKQLKKKANAEDVASSGSDPLDNGDTVITVNNVGKLSDHDWQVNGDEEDADAAVRELVNAALDMMNDESRAMMPEYFISQVELLNRPPKITWQQILKRYVGTISAEKRKTRMRLNRRQPGRFDLSGRMDDKVLKIIVVIDTSASVDDEMISEIINEIFGILAKRKHEITILECDAKVQRVYRIEKPSEVKKKVVGRGGTEFSPAINYINHNRYYRDALMVYFTDGYGESKIPKPRTYRNIWVVFDHVRNLSVHEPYGVVIALER